MQRGFGRSGIHFSYIGEARIVFMIISVAMLVQALGSGVFGVVLGWLLPCWVSESLCRNAGGAH